MGRTLEEIGADHGITKQRVAQVVRRLASPADRQRIRRACDNRRRREAAEVREAERTARRLAAVARGHYCPICRALLERESQRTCGGECSAKWAVVRRHLDPDQHEAHRRAIARSILRHPESRTEAQVAHAHAVLSDDPPPPNRRFTLPQSAAARVLREMGR